MMSDDATDHHHSVTGLLTKGLLLAIQRWVDIAMISCQFDTGMLFWCLLGSLLMSSIVLAYTMANHRSAFRGIPHGYFGIVSAIMQVAAIWEMLDKMFAPATMFDVEQGPARLPKGSRGENLMRGLRKLSIVCVPHLLISVIINASWFYRNFKSDPNEDRILPLIAMIMGLMCLGMACADLSLYIWVDDFFVKENKKLVTIHYGVEVWNRIPTLVAFHQTYSEAHAHWPTWVYLSVDLLCITLLQFASFYTRLSSQKNYGLMVGRFFKTAGWSIPLLVVNFHYFDPGLSFAYINRGYYVIRVVQTAVLLGCMYSTSKFGTADSTAGGQGAAVKIYLYTTLASTVLMAFIVWVAIPYRRKLLFGPDEVRPPAEDGDIPEYTDWSFRNIVTAYSDRPLLDRCGDVLEMLWVLSKIRSPRVRRQILGEVVTSLRLIALPWEGTYVSSFPKQRIKVESSDKLITVFITQEDTETCTIHHGVLESATLCFLLRQDMHIVLTGTFDGAEIRWSDNSKWVRTEQNEVEGLRAVLPLLLPQLVWALRWEEPIGIANGVYVEEHPLLWFLVMYGILLKDASFCTSLYWHLYALGDPSADEDTNVSESYSLKRLAFVRSLVSNDDVFIDDRGRRQTPGPETAGFRLKVLSMLGKQRNMWKQKVRLLRAAHGPQHTYHERTRRVKAMLRRIMRKDDEEDARAPIRRSPSEESGPRDSTRSQRVSQDLARTRRMTQEDILLDEHGNDSSAWASPLDPEIEFTGAEEVEVVRSANAPIVVSMRSQATELGTSRGSEDVDEEESLVKYMIKSGDDLRQDALILQFMALFEKVWHERLPSNLSEWLQLAPYQVLAVTPYAGYVKFVPNSYPLSHVLRASGCSSIVRWLRENHPADMNLADVLDCLCGSVAAYTVATYVLGVGDRHLDNLMLTTEGRFFHVDFGFILGDDPKPFAPRLRLPREIVEALQFTGAPSRRMPPENDDSGSRLSIFLELCQQAFIALRQTSSMWNMLLKLTAAAGGCGVKKLKSKSGRSAALARMNERLHLHVNETDTNAAKEFAKILVTESEAMYPTLLDKLHNVVQFWH